VECFKPLDIRGQVPNQLNETIAWRIGRAVVEELQAKTAVVGHDIRLTSPSLTASLARGMASAGAKVIHIGEVGTEEVYFAVQHLKVDGGIMVTASQNPKD